MDWKKPNNKYPSSLPPTDRNVIGWSEDLNDWEVVYFDCGNGKWYTPDDKLAKDISHWLDIKSPINEEISQCLRRIDYAR
jgi:hypothetical protein